VQEPQDLSEATGWVEAAFVIYDRRNGELRRMRRREPKRFRRGWRQDRLAARPPLGIPVSFRAENGFRSYQRCSTRRT
jgi:hypothetical protein